MRKSLLFALLIALPLGATPSVQSVSPSSGPAAGGTQVTIKGLFTPPATFQVFFGATRAASFQVVDATTITAVTPAHLAGVVPVIVMENSHQSISNVTFAFVGESPAFERMLLPIFTFPTNGAFGSQFVTSMRVSNQGPGNPVHIFGPPSINPVCPVLCPPWNPLTMPVTVPAFGAEDVTPFPFKEPSAPGVFIYVPKTDADRLAMNLRVADISRSAQNFGTEIPVVREREFFTGGRITLLGVPTDPRFRNTLRIYSYTTEAMLMTVTIGNEQHAVPLTPGRDLFDPAYAVFSNFPVNVGPVRVTIDFPPQVGPPGIPPVIYPQTWAFVSVTNNDTQMITTITPQR